MNRDCCHNRLLFPAGNRAAAGITLLELMAAVTISGLVAVAVLTSARIGMRAWEKGQQSVLQLRRTTNVQDMVYLQLSNHLLRTVVVEFSNRRQPMPFFFAEEHRLVLLTSYSARESGRGGIVVADYFAEQQPDQTWSLWLDERPALDGEQLAGWVEGTLQAQDGLRPVLRQFQRANAVLLWKGLSECRFEYRATPPAQADWVSSWSLLARNRMPAAVALQVNADPEKWKGLPPVPVYARLSLEGVNR